MAQGWLVHQAIRSLLADVNMRRNAEVRQEVLAMYTGLISAYAADNPSADLFTRLEMLPYRLNAYALSSYYPRAFVCGDKCSISSPNKRHTPERGFR